LGLVLAIVPTFQFQHPTLVPPEIPAVETPHGQADADDGGGQSGEKKETDGVGTGGNGEIIQSDGGGKVLGNDQNDKGEFNNSVEKIDINDEKNNENLNFENSILSNNLLQFSPQNVISPITTLVTNLDQVPAIQLTPSVIPQTNNNEQNNQNSEKALNLLPIPHAINIVDPHSHIELATAQQE